MLTPCTLARNRHQTLAIRGSSDRNRLCRVVCALQERFVGTNWILRLNRGSMTLQNPSDQNEVVTVFVDVENRLARKLGQSGLAEDPVVVAAELCPQPKFARDCMRAELRARFGANYVDPENGRDSEWRIAPHDDHHFDLIFLPPGRCPIKSERFLTALIAWTEESREGAEIGIGAIYNQVLMSCLAGEWSGDFAQNDTALQGSFPMRFTVSSVDPQTGEIQGEMYWETLQRTNTRFTGQVNDGIATWNEFELLSDSPERTWERSVVLDGTYKAWLGGDNQLQGTWLPPNDQNKPADAEAVYSFTLKQAE